MCKRSVLLYRCFDIIISEINSRCCITPGNLPDKAFTSEIIICQIFGNAVFGGGFKFAVYKIRQQPYLLFIKIIKQWNGNVFSKLLKILICNGINHPGLA